MNYDEEKFDFLAFVSELEKEKDLQDVFTKIRSEIARTERLCLERGAGTARIRREAPAYLRQLQCLYESLLDGNLSALLRPHERAFFQTIVNKLRALQRPPPATPENSPP
jgi:hypothetical protein